MVKRRKKTLFELSFRIDDPLNIPDPVPKIKIRKPLKRKKKK